MTDHVRAAVPAEHVPPRILSMLRRLWSSGHAAYLVGGSLRDALLGRRETDWDIATDARPPRIQALFPGSHYENRFGTVLVPEEGDVVEVTTFRLDHAYGDHRRPDSVTFGTDLSQDLARRDFTVNALAWGRGPNDAAPDLVDLFGGLDDLRAGILRAVGDPEKRFDEDALRLIRAARLAGQLGFAIEPQTLVAMRRTAGLVRWVSNERIGQELRKMLHAPEPSLALRVLSDTRVLDGALPELAEQRGLPQAKAPGMDCWEHTVQTVDAAVRIAPGDEILALAALFHDAGKPRTRGGGHFIGHDEVGAQIADETLRRLAIERVVAEQVVHLIRHHMFNYEPAWSDAAVRRLVQRVGRDAIPRLLQLREADNIGSGQSSGGAPLDELRRRIEEQEAEGFPLSVSDLAVDGNDLMRELDLRPGPLIGTLLDRLLDSTIADPSRNTFRQSILDARGWLPELLAKNGSAPARADGTGTGAAAGEEPGR